MTAVFKILIGFFGALVFLVIGFNNAKGGVDTMTFEIKSSAFKTNDAIPREYTCEGADISPDLTWNDSPKGVKSFSLIMDDPDAPMGTFTHWIIYDIPSDFKGLARAIANSATIEKEIKQGINDFGKIGYGGPCPPRGHGRHRYYFKLMALDVSTLAVLPGSSRKEVEKAIKGHIIKETKYMGVYER